MLQFEYQYIELYLNYFIICAASYFITAYIFFKAQNTRIEKTVIKSLLTFGVIISVVFTCVRLYNVSLAHLFRFIGTPVLLCFLYGNKDNRLKTFTTGLISYSLESVFETVTTLFQGTILWMLGIVLNDLLAYILVVLFTFAICFLFMRVKRFKKGFQFFQEENNLGLGLAMSGIVMLLKCINLRDNKDKIYLYVVFVIGIVVIGFGLYLWIRRSITAHYRERLQLKSEEHYKELLEQSKKEIEKLNQSNEYLAKIVHRDNHLMGALDSSINAYFNSTDEIEKDNLLHEIHTLAKERGKLIAKEQLDSKLLPTMGNHLIDGAITDLYIKAAAHGIDFSLTVSSTVDEIIGKYISQTDLHTMLCDHIKDAIIAVDNRGEAGGRILVNLSMQNDNYCIDIYDNGVEFSIDTLSKLGLKRVTTHSDTGGSGIGFMTTFETLKKAYASLVITEFENKTPFSKSVTFRFDGENAYIIHSYRSEELMKNINRADLVIDN